MLLCLSVCMLGITSIVCIIQPHLLVSANVASAKKILVNGPDLSSIPSQLPIHEVSTFLSVCNIRPQ